MLKVHVWLPYQDMVGHASLSYGGSYVSFWPKTSAGMKDLKVKRSQAGQLMENLAQDIRSEGGRDPITVIVPSTNLGNLQKFAADFISDVPDYQLAKFNCSHVVAACLKAVSGKDPSFRPNARDYNKLGKFLGQGIWTPHEVLRYARELAKGYRQ